MKKTGKICPHPPHRMYTWWADDAKGRHLMVACCDCGEVLRGADNGEENP